MTRITTFVLNHCGYAPTLRLQPARELFVGKGEGKATMICSFETASSLGN